MLYQIADTILSQLGGNKFLAMTGAHNLVRDRNSLSMQLRRNKSTSNFLTIELNELDLYDVVFVSDYSLSTDFLDYVKEYNNIDAENLQRVFTDHTGMYTSL